MIEPLTYVYCVVRSARRPALRGVPAGMPGGGPVRALDAGNAVWLIVSSVERDAYGERAIAEGLSEMAWVSRCALAHEGVVEKFLRARALLPMQLFTLFASDARAVASVMTDRARITRLLDRLEQQLEWGVRVTAAPGGPAAQGAAPARSGADYLARKREAFEGARRRAASAAAAAERLYRAASREATAARRRDLGAGGGSVPPVLDAAFLVPADRVRPFREVIRREGPALRAENLRISVTGPWPPYNFIDMRIPVRRGAGAATGGRAARSSSGRRRAAVGAGRR